MICKLSIILTDMLENEHIIQTADREVYEYGFQITMANITLSLIHISPAGTARPHKSYFECPLCRQVLHS